MWEARSLPVNGLRSSAGNGGTRYWRKIRLEEANLKVAFGAEYDSYRGDTWALIPGLF